MLIRKILPTDSPLLSAYYVKNAKHFKAWEPQKPYGFDSLAEWKKRIALKIKEQDQELAAYFIALTQDSKEVIAHCNFTQIFKGPFRACYMGYGIAENFAGKGHMQVLCRYAIRYAFEELQLHRIMANYMPHNNRSAKLLNRLGFSIEGRAQRYLKINGRWEDHMLTSLINPDTRI